MPQFCVLFGGFAPFDEDTAADRYRSRGKYVSQFVQAVKQSQKEGFLLKEEAAELRRRAAQAGGGR